MEITLNDPWFQLVKEGKKTYEGRRATLKTKSIKIGDIIIIKHHTDNTQPPYYAIVTEVLEFRNFQEALATLPLQEVLPIQNITIEKGIEIYKQYVSIRTQEKDGVIMIKLGVSSQDPNKT